MNAGKVIKKLRLEHNMTQSDFAKVLGVNKSSVQKYESGAVSNLKMSTIRTICEKFNTSPYGLVFPEKVPDFEDQKKIHILECENNFLLKLNTEGFKKVLEYAKDLHDSGNYSISENSKGCNEIV